MTWPTNVAHERLGLAEGHRSGACQKLLLASAGTLTSWEMFERSIHRGEVLLHHGFAPPAIGFLNGVLNGGNGIRTRQHSADGEETGLHYGVDAAAHPGFFRHLDGVDHERSAVSSG